MACIEVYATGKNSLSYWKARIWLPMAFKIIPDTPTKSCWSQAQFQKGQPIPCKTMYAFLAHLWVREFWPQIYSPWQAMDWGLLSKLLASTKTGGTYNAERSNFSSTLARELLEDFFKVLCGHNKVSPGHLEAPLATSKWHALLVYSGCRHGKMLTDQ